MKIKRLCVFCGSNEGRNPAYKDAAIHLGLVLAKEKIELIYGGANIGLMGVLANACLDAGGEVTGVIPASLVGREVAGERVESRNLTRLEIVKTMHQRKMRMASLADAFIALPGGIGTLEELFEIFTWSQLGFHAKPIGILNAEGFYDPLLNFCDQLVHEGFLNIETRSILSDHANPALLIELFKNKAPSVQNPTHLQEGTL